MNGSTPGGPGSGDGWGRALLGTMGALMIVGGMAIALLAAITWPIPYVTATPGIVAMGYGVTLVLGCAFYDIAEVTTGYLGMPRVKVRSKP